MEQLKYIIEDSTIAEILGVQNFTNDESAVLELVKNAYDAKATLLSLCFNNNQLIISDNGIGMDASDFKRHWMHVGISSKAYKVVDNNNNVRVLAGSKGIGRFALSRLGRNIEIYSKKLGSIGVIWKTDWNGSLLNEEESLKECGTKIIISNLREKWGKKKVENLVEFLSKTYNDTSMKIEISHSNITRVVTKCFSIPKLGKNCLSNIQLKFDSEKCVLTTQVQSDEFRDEAKKYCSKIDLNKFSSKIDIIDEFKVSEELELSIEELEEYLQKIGNFSAEMYFDINSTTVEMEKFLYKYSRLPESFKGGVILYRNAFSISAYEGKKDWLGLGKRYRKSPAAASHPTGAWRVRENQLSGKVEIDKKINANLKDLSNRQGLDENIYYQLFIDIILTGIKEFERYRQSIIRRINVKNKEPEYKPTPVSDKVVSNPRAVSKLSSEEAKQLATEIKLYRKESSEYKRDKVDVEKRYKYDVRILNVLATTGLKASSIAHEMRNDRNAIADNSDNIVLALKEYDMWNDLLTPDRTEKAYKNIPLLIKSNREISAKIVAFMDTMLSEVEKKQFEATWQSIMDLLSKIKSIWQRDYAWVTITLQVEDDICFLMSEDIVRVIFDNLILNSIQQNDKLLDHLDIRIQAEEQNDLIRFVYSDNGKGLDKKYNLNPRKILEVHETNRKNGHGLGMWIVNNTTVMSGGEIIQINGQNGFLMEFLVGGKM